MASQNFIARPGLQFTQTGSGVVNRTIESKLSDLVSVKDYGAIGNGSANDTTAVQNAAAAGTYYVPAGLYSTTIATKASLPGRFSGLGSIRCADNNKTGLYYSNVSSPPTSSGNADSPLTAFNGDLTKCQFPVEHWITGANTVGQPTTGYSYTPEVFPHYTYLYNSSGWNQQTSGNGGRTGIAAYRTKIFQAGQGDLVCFNGSAFVTGTRAGSTNFLANPAAVLFNGDMTAGANGVYMNPYETICDDNGFDAACVGVVNNFNRTVATGAKSAVWLGYRAQSTGAATCDALVSATGKWVTGLDLSMSGLDFGANKAAISLKGNDRIYFNNAAIASGNLDGDWRTTVFNGDYLEYNSSGSFIHFVRGGSSKLQIGSSDVIVANANFGVNVGSGSTAFVRGLQTGFGLPTGTTNTASFNTATVTLTQLAEYVAGLVARIHSSTSGAHALIGP